jgi:hypothetical protein
MWIVYLAVGVALVLALVAVFYFVARLLWRQGPAGKVVVVLVLLALGPTLYRAGVPSRAAYLDEFTRLSGLVLPASTEVLERSASFPDHKGRYRACMMVRLAPSEAQAVQRRLQLSLPAQQLQSCGTTGRARRSRDDDFRGATQRSRESRMADPQASGRAVILLGFGSTGCLLLRRIMIECAASLLLGELL